MDRNVPLGFDGDGNRIAVPDGARAFRVSRAVYDLETGRPLVLPLDATLDDLLDRVYEPIRYRLEFVDGDGHVIRGAQVALTAVPGEERTARSFETNGLTRSLQLVERLVDANCSAVTAMASALAPIEPAPLPPPALPPADIFNMLRDLIGVFAGGANAPDGKAAAASNGGGSL